MIYLRRCYNYIICPAEGWAHVLKSWLFRDQRPALIDKERHKYMRLTSTVEASSSIANCTSMLTKFMLNKQKILIIKWCLPLE